MHAGKLEVEHVGGPSIVVGAGGEAFDARSRDGAGWCVCAVKNASSCRVAIEQYVAWCPQ